MTKPLAIDLYCGLGGWTEGLLAEGYDVVGFDIERHRYQERILPDYGAVKKPGGIMRPDDPNYANRGPLDNQFAHANEAMIRNAPLTGRWVEYPGLLVIQDVLTLHGSQFRNAALIVASPPCQEYSYMAMPWKLAKAKAAAIRADTTGESLERLNRLFHACFRIQAEASLAAGRHIPMLVENVRGAQPWVGRAAWNFGSFYLWGDVPALMPFTAQAQKFNPDGTAHPPGSWFAIADSNNRGSKGIPHRTKGDWTNPAEHEGVKQGGDWSNASQPSLSRLYGSKSPQRKMASAMIAKIPLPLSRHIAQVYKPRQEAA